MISVIVPSIRPQHLNRLYESIKKSYSGKFEMIVISPYTLPRGLDELGVVHIQDWGSPIRCQQIGLVRSKGDYITWAADDGVFTDGSLDIAFNMLADKDENSLVMGKYIEGEDDGDFKMKEDEYYILNNHDATKVKYVPDRCFMLNVGLVPRKLLVKFGGWDCKFEVCPMAYNDLAVRMQNHGVKFIIQQEIMFKCSHMPNTTGDHAPIHNAQIKHDQPLFREIWQTSESQARDYIDINNWEKAQEKWRRRFG